MPGGSAVRRARRGHRQAVRARGSQADPQPGRAFPFGAFRTASGDELEVRSRGADRGSASAPAGRPKPPLVFLHGSYHAAWCWEENFFPWFAARGHESYAPSFRGHGSSGGGDPRGERLERHAQDVLEFLGGLDRPVLIGHSFGGLVAQAVMASEACPPLERCVLLNSVPPVGNGPMTLRFLWDNPLNAFRVTRGFIAKTFGGSAPQRRARARRLTPGNPRTGRGRVPLDVLFGRPAGRAGPGVPGPDRGEQRGPAAGPQAVEAVATHPAPRRPPARHGHRLRPRHGCGPGGGGGGGGVLRRHAQAAGRGPRQYARHELGGRGARHPRGSRARRWRRRRGGEGRRRRTAGFSSTTRSSNFESTRF